MTVRNWFLNWVRSQPIEVAKIHDGYFDEVHRVAAELGWCDGTGGMEWKRVKGEWIAAGRPPGVGAFIRSRANGGLEA